MSDTTDPVVAMRKRRRRQGLLAGAVVVVAVLIVFVAGFVVRPDPCSQVALLCCKYPEIASSKCGYNAERIRTYGVPERCEQALDKIDRDEELLPNPDSLPLSWDLELYLYVIPPEMSARTLKLIEDALPDAHLR